MLGDQSYSSNDIDVTLGSFNIVEDGLIIVDREEQDETTQLHINDMIGYIDRLKNEFDTSTGMTIFLPRLTASMFEEAEIQKRIYSLARNVSIVFV
jgi:hypothetical protein